MSAKRRRPNTATQIVARLLHCEPTEVDILRASLRIAIDEGIAQLRNHRDGAAKGNQQKREDARVFADAIAAIRAQKTHLKTDTDAIRWYLRDTDPDVWDACEPAQRTRLIRNAQQRLRLARQQRQTRREK